MTKKAIDKINELFKEKIRLFDEDLYPHCKLYGSQKEFMSLFEVIYEAGEYEDIYEDDLYDAFLMDYRSGVWIGYDDLVYILEGHNTEDMSHSPWFYYREDPKGKRPRTFKPICKIYLTPDKSAALFYVYDFNELDLRRRTNTFYLVDMSKMIPPRDDDDDDDDDE